MTLSDYKAGVDENNDNSIDYYTATITSAQDYYAFGMTMLGRNFTSSSYTFGMNGQEKDDEISNVSGANTTAMFWEYDSRLGRRWNIDPKPTVGISDYACFANNPIQFSDVSGDTISFNFFTVLKDWYNWVANNGVKNQIHDGTYIIFGHGSRTALFDRGTRVFKVDDIISRLSKNKYFKKDLKDGKTIKLFLLSCHSGEGKNSIAEQISKKYPNIIVVAADGSCIYGPKNGRPDVSVDNEKDNTGGFITFINGVKKYKQIYSYNKKTCEYNLGALKPYKEDENDKSNENDEIDKNDKSKKQEKDKVKKTK